MASLATQLGYPSNPAEIEARVDAMRDKRKFAVYVAEDESGAVIGWISAFVFIAVESEACGEINGLVWLTAHGPAVQAKSCCRQWKHGRVAGPHIRMRAVERSARACASFLSSTRV